MNVMDKLDSLVAKKNSRVCVGLDPTEIPKTLLAEYDDDVAAATLKFCKDIILAVKDYAVAVKPNIAFYESIGDSSTGEGVAVYHQIAKFASEQGLFVIGDVKRSDIGKTAAQYAKAYLSAGSPFDMITINPFFGSDGVLPFVEMAKENDKGVYVLVKTSNKTSGEIQDVIDRVTGEFIYETLAHNTYFWGAKLMGNSGYRAIGAVVGATYPKHAEILRKTHPTVPFLVPGYGAQGATAEDVAVNFDMEGNGALVNASSSIMYAYKKLNSPYYDSYHSTEETKKMRDAINTAIFK